MAPARTRDVSLLSRYSEFGLRPRSAFEAGTSSIKLKVYRHAPGQREEILGEAKAQLHELMTGAWRVPSEAILPSCLNPRANDRTRTRLAGRKARRRHRHAVPAAVRTPSARRNRFGALPPDTGQVCAGVVAGHRVARSAGFGAGAWGAVRRRGASPSLWVFVPSHRSRRASPARTPRPSCSISNATARHAKA